MIFENLVCINLENFQQAGDIEEILESNGIEITENIHPYLLWTLKNDLKKIWYDPTHDEYVIFEDLNGEFIYLDHFINTLKNFPSLDRKKYFDVNDILDKINKYGVGSLTKEEKDFLENS